MSNRKLLVSICSLEPFQENVLATMKRAASGAKPEEPIHRVYFMSEDDLFSTLSPKRMQLIKFLKNNGPLSCRKLAAALNRAYANVHEDVKQLTQLEVILRDNDKKPFVPWDEIDINVSLVA